MIRQSLAKNRIGMNAEFNFRGEEPGRLENFSDAVFALAITLLLISTSPPTNFEQIRRFTYDLIPFSLCIVIIIMIWHEHYVFYLRYGLRNTRVILLNTLFLVIVLFYVYPLKFITKLVLYPIAILAGNDGIVRELNAMIKGEDVAELMIIYGLGAASVFFVLRQMYSYAYSCADQLELSEIERFDTKSKIMTNTILGTLPLVSVLIAMLFFKKWYAGLFSGMTYLLYTPIFMWYGRKVEKKRAELLREISEGGRD